MKFITIAVAALMTAASFAEKQTETVDRLDRMISGDSPEEVSSPVGSVRSYAFAHMTGLKRVYLDSVTNIGHSVFYSCRDLREVSLNSLDADTCHIGPVFVGCTALEHVYLRGTVFRPADRSVAFPFGAPGGNLRVRFHFKNGVFDIRGQEVEE